MMKIAEYLKSKDLSEIVLLFLEMHRPFRGIAHSFCALIEPGAGFLGYAPYVQEIRHAFSSSTEYEKFIQELKN